MANCGAIALPSPATSGAAALLVSAAAAAAAKADANGQSLICWLGRQQNIHRADWLALTFLAGLQLLRHLGLDSCNLGSLNQLGRGIREH